MFQAFPVIQLFDTLTQSFFVARRTLYFKEPPPKFFKTYLKDKGNTYFLVISRNYCYLQKLLLEIISSFLSRKIRSSLMV